MLYGNYFNMTMLYFNLSDFFLEKLIL